MKSTKAIAKIIGLMWLLGLCVNICDARQMTPCDIYSTYQVRIFHQQEKESLALDAVRDILGELKKVSKTAEDFQIIDRIENMYDSVFGEQHSIFVEKFGISEVATMMYVEYQIMTSIWDKNGGESPSRTETEQLKLSQLWQAVQNTQEYKMAKSKLKQVIGAFSWREIKYDFYALVATKQYQEYKKYLDSTDKMKKLIEYTIKNACSQSKNQKP